ncbi:MAG: type I DNA topoisomerase [Acidiferrobacteraceae bacterium]
MKLLIVESPTKAKHIQHFLGKGWQVKASLGHIRDLPVTGDSAYIRPPDFKMRYVISDKHKEIVAGLKSAASKAEGVYLATDPDREGEAISWHLAQVLGIKSAAALRVTYQEVTESAVLKAVANPRHINMTLVAAQEARRALDRIVGWEVSGPLSRALNTKASAGRVQTPALRLIVERERAIRAFQSTSWCQVQAQMAGNWHATWQDGVRDGEYFQDRVFAQALVAALPALPLTVTQASSKPSREAPPPPFTTSSLQMDASRALHIDAEQVMRLAQGLFERGLITYHRTDSPNLSEEGESLLRAEAKRRHWPLSDKPRRWKAKGDAQEAHEAIRPTDPANTGTELAPADRDLYVLVWKRAMASQMTDALYQITGATLDGGVFHGRPAVFKATGRVLKDLGWRRLYTESQDDGEAQDPSAANNPVPMLSLGAVLKAERGEIIEKKTTAPKRFTQATLIAELEKHGVGRPSTYASIIKVLFYRAYIEQKRQALSPTDTGERAIDVLLPFGFCSVDYTREIEATLDKIASGQSRPKELLTRAYQDVQAILSTMPAAQARAPLVAGKDAPDCPACAGAQHGKLATAKTMSGRDYFSCVACHAKFWPARSGKVVGEQWSAFKPVQTGSSKTTGSTGSGGKKRVGSRRKAG